MRIETQSRAMKGNSEMFCKNCGTQLSEGAKFCSTCGAAIEEDLQINSSAMVSAPSNNAKKKRTGIIAVAAVIILVIILIFGGGAGYEKTIDSFFEGLFEADSKLFVSTLSEEYIEEQIDYYGYRNKAVLIEKLQDNMDDLAEEFADELGKNWKYKYEIVDVEKYEDEVEVTIDLELSGRKGEESDVWILVLIKEGNKWYVDSFYSA